MPVPVRWYRHHDEDPVRIAEPPKAVSSAVRIVPENPVARSDRRRDAVGRLDCAATREHEDENSVGERVGVELHVFTEGRRPVHSRHGNARRDGHEATAIGPFDSLRELDHYGVRLAVLATEQPDELHEATPNGT